MFDSLHCSTNQEVFEKHVYDKSSYYEKYGQFLIMQRKPSCATTKSTLFTVSKDKWNTKEDTSKSLKNALHVLRAPLQLKQIRTEKIKPVALAVIELC